MCDIYQNSVLTISAACSASDCAGFLQERVAHDPIKLGTTRRLQSLCFRPAIDHSRGLLDDPIHSRAWTFQEMMLPRRLLSFNSQELTWECETLRQCECGQIEFEDPVKGQFPELGRAAYRKYARVMTEERYYGRESGNRGFVGFHPYWRRILVPEYTRRALSKDSDRLIALHAIASDVQSGLHDRYLAGLWEGDLVSHLRWESVDHQCLPADNQSPSWSWASIRGPVVPYHDEEFHNRMLDRVTMNKYGLGGMTIVGADGLTAYGHRPCEEIPKDSIVVTTSAIEVRYIKNKETGQHEFYANASSTESPRPTAPVPLKVEFRPDTPLCCQPDGSLSRSATRGYLETRHHDYALAIMLLLEVAGDCDLCVLVCGHVPAATKPNTCRRLGIGMIRNPNFDSLAPHLSRKEFVLI